MRLVAWIAVIASVLSVGGCGSISNEMLYYDAYLNARVYLQDMLSTEEVKNPLSAKHPLSKSKPDMAPRALSVSSAQETYDFPVFEAEFSFPVFSPVKESNYLSMETPRRFACMKDDSRFVFVCPHLIHGMQLDYRNDLSKNRAKGKIPASVRFAYALFNQRSPWDRIVCILNTDAGGLRRSHSIDHRMLTITLLGVKAFVYPCDFDAPLKYYESPHLKCFLGGPDVIRTVSKQPDKDYDPEDPNQLNEMMSKWNDLPAASVDERLEFNAIVSDPSGQHVVDVGFRYPVDVDPNEAAHQTLKFIGQCRFKQEAMRTQP